MKPLFTDKEVIEIKEQVYSSSSKPIGVFISDLHLNESNIDLVKGVITKSIQIAQMLGFNTVYCGGDIFDSRKAQSLLIQSTFEEILNYFRQSEVKFVVTPGNHDKTNYRSKKSFLDAFHISPHLFDKLDTPYKYFEVVDLYGQFQLTEDVVLHLTPFFEDEEYLENLSNHQKHINKKKTNVHLTHIGFEGSVMNSGITVGGGVGKSIGNLFDLTLVGHYHDYQELYDGSVVYIGSTYQCNFGENNKKGITILMDDLSLKQVKLGTPEFVKYEVNVKDFSEKEIQSLKKEKSESGNTIRVVLKGAEEDVNSFNKQLLLNEGIEVEKKVDKVVRETVEEEVEKFEETTILSSLKNFLTSKGLPEEEILVGENYLMRGLTTQKN